MGFNRLTVRNKLAISFGIQFVALAGVLVLVLAGTARDTVLATAIAGLLGGGACAWWTTRSIERALREAVNITRRMAQGDLSQTIDTEAAGEFGQLLQALHDMGERMFVAVAGIRTGTMAIASMAGMLGNDNVALSERTTSQAASLEETASSMEELTSTVRQNASNAQEANELAVSASSYASKGGQVVHDVVNTMGSIKDSSNKISDIIGVINGIAFQINILALNAAVEAARAGDHGRGFAVVAAEVRALAQRSASAAKEIGQLVGESVSRVETGSRLVAEAGHTMNDIIASVERMKAIMDAITTASQEQSAGIEETNRAIIHIDSATQKNAALVDDATRTTSTLREQAVVLTHAVVTFKLGEREFGNADDVVSMVREAVAFMKTNGREALLADVNKLGGGRFIDRDLYLILYSDKTECIGHGVNPRLLRVDGNVFTDAKGKRFVKEVVDKANIQGTGWIDYTWANPITQELLPKSSYFEKTGNVVVSCGYYKRDAK